MTLRNNTERPETVEVGGNVIAGYEMINIFNCVERMLKKKNNWANPFGDGKTSLYILQSLKRM